VDELDRGDPGEVALENALRKARAARALGTEAAETGAEVVLGCDTLVALDGTIYGKPGDEAEARATLRALSGATHEVFSGLVLLFGDGREQRTALVRTAVTFRELEEGTLDWYLAKGGAGASGGGRLRERRRLTAGEVARHLSGPFARGKRSSVTMVPTEI